MKERFYMYVDECGDQNLSNFEPTFPIFSLCGIIVSEQQNNALKEKVNAMKNRFWGTEGIILHSRDIRKCQKGFEILFNLDVKREFYNAVNEILGETEAYKVVSCSILKKKTTSASLENSTTCMPSLFHTLWSVQSSTLMI